MSPQTNISAGKASVDSRPVRVQTDLESEPVPVSSLAQQVPYSGSYQQYQDVLQIAVAECETLVLKDEEYQGSWKKRRRGVFHMLARKWDRIEVLMEQYNDDIFDALEDESRIDSLQDDIRDLRNYLLLILNEDHINSRTCADLRKYERFVDVRDQCEKAEEPTV